MRTEGPNPVACAPLCHSAGSGGKGVEKPSRWAFPPNRRRSWAAGTGLGAGHPRALSAGDERWYEPVGRSPGPGPPAHPALGSSARREQGPRPSAGKSARRDSESGTGDARHAGAHRGDGHADDRDADHTSPPCRSIPRSRRSRRGTIADPPRRRCAPLAMRRFKIAPQALEIIARKGPCRRAFRTALRSQIAAGARVMHRRSRLRWSQKGPRRRAFRRHADKSVARFVMVRLAESA